MKSYKNITSIVLSMLLIITSVGALFPMSAFAEETSAEEPLTNNTVSFTAEQLQVLQVPDTDIPELMTRAEIDEKDHAVRLKAEEPNKSTVVFQNRDGSKTAYFYNTPVKYTDENGNIKDKSSKISAYSGMYDGKNYAYAMTDNDVKVYFSRVGTDGVKLASGGYNVEMIPVNTSSLLIPSVSAVNDNTLRYNNVYGLGTAIEYKTLLNGVKEDIVLSKYTGQSSFTFMLYTDGLALVENGGEFYLADTAGARVASLGRVIATDSGSKTVYGTMNYNTVRAGAQYLVNISVDNAFLTASDTVYPVRIDPTVTIDQGDTGYMNRIEDTGLYTSDATLTGLTSDVYPVGYFSSNVGVGRMAIRFPMFVDPWADNMLSSYQYLANIEGDEIVYASLSLYAKSVSGSTNIKVYPMTNTPTFSVSGRQCDTTVFNSYDSIYGTSATTVSSTGRKSFNVTSIVRLWADFDFENSNGGGFNPVSGLMVKNNDEDITGNLVSFYSAMYYDPNYQPNLSVTYRTDARYLNNYVTKEFLSYNGSIGADTEGGSPGLDYKWYFDSVGTDTYVIRSAKDYSKVLYSNGSTFSVQTISVNTSSSSLGVNYKWIIDSHQSNWYILSAVNTEYGLAILNGTVKLASVYNNECLWRMKNVDDYAPLQGFTIWIGGLDASLTETNLYMYNVGDTFNFTMTFNPSSADFVEWDDFVLDYNLTVFSVTEGQITKLCYESPTDDRGFDILFIHKITGKSVNVYIICE